MGQVMGEKDFPAALTLFDEAARDGRGPAVSPTVRASTSLGR